MLRIDQEECEVTEPLPELLYSPSLGGSGGGRSPPTKVVDKPPSKAADPPHRIRLEAAMESSFGTFSALTVVPVERLPFVDVSGRCRMPIGPGGSRQLEVRPTSSKRSVISLPIPGPPQPQQGYLGTAASSTTTAQAHSTAPMLRSLSARTAVVPPRRSPTGGGLLRRPATGCPAAAV